MDPTSGVKVEYTDPSDIFPAFARELRPRLPLKDLHWSSSSRPVRSIDSLDIKLVSNDISNPKTEITCSGSVRAISDTRTVSNNDGPRKARRHQIPGLRQTPYLKIFLLCCNDVDLYKTNARRQLRDWVKEHTTTPQSSASLNTQDNHDAFEWLIVYVNRVPADGQGTTPRPSSRTGEGSTEKRPTSSRWSSRNSASIIEKLRSDFNGTSKNAIERVVEVQLSESTTDSCQHVHGNAQDSNKGWNDLIFKLKTQILASFDLRVSQYEEDIRERESQKQVVGWNFNTFFVLKEGLAMGFESMSLLEDALTVYQELDFGLKTVINEHLSDRPEQSTAHFVDYTEDLYRSFKQGEAFTGGHSDETSKAGEIVADPGAYLLNTDRKPFRELILGNRISVFEFQCYVFARQTSLSLRLANVINKYEYCSTNLASQNGPTEENERSSDLSELSKPRDHEPENCIILAEVVKSSVDFITCTARVIREDIECAVNQDKAGQQSSERSLDNVSGEEIGRFVTSWLFSAGQRILEVTSTRSLDTQLNPLLPQLTQHYSVSKSHHGQIHITEYVDIVHYGDLPARTSSLRSSNPTASSTNLLQLSPDLKSPNAFGSFPPGSPRLGFQELAAQRGDLLALKKRLLTDLGSQQGGWQVGLAYVQMLCEDHGCSLQDVDLSEKTVENKAVDTSSPKIAKVSSTTGICNKMLLSAVTSNDYFHMQYEVWAPPCD